MIPDFDDDGDLPIGVFPATLSQVLDRFGKGSGQREIVGRRLDRIYRLAFATGHLARVVVFGSFVTNKSEPNDVDVVIIMKDDFDPDQLSGEAALLFDHAAAQSHFGASVFWLRRFAILGDPQQFIEDWQIRRDRQRRGIIEIIQERA